MVQVIREKIKSFNGLTHRVSIQVSDRLNSFMEKEGRDKLMMDYVVEAWIINITKLLVVMSISALLGIFFETVITLISFNIIRSRAYGLHARSSLGCFISSILYFVVFVYIADMIVLDNMAVAIGFAIIIPLIWIYAPSDTDKRPLVGADMRKSLKMQSVLAAIVVAAAALLIPYGRIKSLILLGAIVETISILPITYKIFKRRYKNYENYERRT